MKGSQDNGPAGVAGVGNGLSHLRRSSGVMLHVTSLPSCCGIGDLGPGAREFAANLSAAGQLWWQMLPIGPTGYGNSPYQALSSFAGNPVLVSPEVLAGLGLCDDVTAGPPASRVDFEAVVAQRGALLAAAAERLRSDRDSPVAERFLDFREQERPRWLADYALYAALKERHGLRPWTAWDRAVAERDEDALAEARRALASEIEVHEIMQFLFFDQWRELRRVCATHGVGLVGDLPLYAAHDSADVWSHQELFALDSAGMPTFVAGVPPDYFSETGQRWGNPLYDWEVAAGDGYAWWRSRVRHQLDLFDVVRIDHFRGIAGYWAIPADEPTAVGGSWREGPGADMLRHIVDDLGSLPLIAEDLGFITDDVVALRTRFQLPGMRIAQFGFDDAPDTGIHDPATYPSDVWAYTGTHDNDTTVGWFDRHDTSADGASVYHKVLRDRIGDEDVNWGLVGLVAASEASVAVYPAQDLLGLGSEARMNTPGTEFGNWTWRLTPGQLDGAVFERLHSVTREADRV